ncbi:hypothetical protein KAS31_05150 [Candidatus Parcubacteria bacterium]|nr:hypothetical protein [Candidatus Parcubacteria bacterium]
MGRYTRCVIDKDDEFYDAIGGFMICAIAILLLVGLFGALETDLASDHIDEENNLHLALQGKETNDAKALATAQAINDMYHGEFDDWLYLGSLVGSKDTIDNDRNSIGFAILNWNKTIQYLEDPDKAIPENNAWENALRWYLKFVLFIFFLAINLGYVFGAANSQLSDVYKYPWKEKWAIPWAIPLAPYLLLTQPFVLLYMIIREPLEFGYRAIIAWNDHLESVQVRSTVISVEEAETEPEPEIKPRKKLFRRHSDYVRSENEIRELEKQFEEIVKGATKNAESSKKNFEIFFKNVLGREMRNMESSIGRSRDKLSELGSNIERIQKELLKETKQKKDIENAIALVDPEETAKEFEKILRLPLVKAIEITNKSNVVNIYTKKIYINYNGKVFEIGNFLISLNIRYYSNEIRNLTNTTHYDRHHPYNGNDFSTSFCFGKTNNMINDSLRENNIFLVTTLILQALQTGGGDSTEEIDYWKRVE